MAVSIRELDEFGRRQLATATFEVSPRESALLLAHVLGLTESQILSRDREGVDRGSADRFHSLIRRRLTGEPVAYLIGQKEFYGRSFAVDSRVLIPRPETEHLIEEVLALDLPPRPRVLDLGTGSGCLAITLALELNARAVGVDVSSAALAVAAANIRRHRTGDRVRLVAADLAAGLDLQPFDLVVSNPPYIGGDEAESLSQEVSRFEPATALFAPRSSDAMIARLFDELDELQAGVPLVIEMGYLHGERLDNLLAGGRFTLCNTKRDYAGVERIAVVEQRRANTSR
ncbi:MAG: peptide chain release factor N(5)-glutamine methyltransferase [Acidobacteriota bacterium]|nr:peptide chain release factor N(5)-glutamine methyltransferase [Acidobacteriota bacterium]